MVSFRDLRKARTFILLFEFNLNIKTLGSSSWGWAPGDRFQTGGKELEGAYFTQATGMLSLVLSLINGHRYTEIYSYLLREMDHKKSWEPKNWCFWIVVLERTLESPLDCRRSNQSILMIDPGFPGMNDTKAEAPVLWPPHAKSWLIGKDSDAGRDWDQEEKGTTDDEMAWRHLGLNGRESGWTPGDGNGQGGWALMWFMGSQRVGHNWATELNWTQYKLNKQGDNIQPWITPFPIWNQSVFPCPVRTVASWPA